MHVAICFEFPALNGGENSMLALVSSLQELGIRFTAIAPEAGPLADRLAELLIRVEPWRSGMPDEQLPSLDQRRHSLLDAISRCKPDLVHSNSLNISRMLGPVVHQLGLPSVGHLRDIIKLSAQAVRDLARHGRILAVSEATKAFHVAQGLPAAQTHVLYNGIDLQQFRSQPSNGYLHRELGLPESQALVGGIGQLGLRKGWEVAIRGFRIATERNVESSWPEPHLLIVGEQHSGKSETNEYVARLHAMASSSDLNGRVHFLGRRNDVPRLLNELALLIHPARQEPLGRVLLEAAATGTPLIATDVGGTSEIFPSATKSAVLVPVDTPEAIAGALNRVLNGPAAAKAMGARARGEIERRFSIGPCVEALHNHYIHASKTAPRVDHATGD